jgi:hypothetical protein
MQLAASALNVGEGVIWVGQLCRGFQLCSVFDDGFPHITVKVLQSFSLPAHFYNVSKVSHILKASIPTIPVFLGYCALIMRSFAILPSDTMQMHHIHYQDHACLKS